MVFEKNQGKIFLFFENWQTLTRFFCGTIKNPAKRKPYYLVFRNNNTIVRGFSKN